MRSSIRQTRYLNQRASLKRYQRGITLIEVLIAIFIFAMMTMMFAAVVPSSLRSARYAATYGHAVETANRKLDQLLEAGYNRLDTADLQSLGIIDSTAPTTSSNSYGAITTYTFTNNNTSSNANNPDNLSSYFPGGATGTIRIESWGPSVATLNSSTAYMMDMATVTISWRDAGGALQSYAMSTVIPQMTIN